VVPQNWPHVVVNHTRYDWVNGPSVNYNEIVGLAIDEAGGRAFVTEYAGLDSVVSTARVFDANWDAAAFETIEPVDVVDELDSQGLVTCEGGECSFAHPQVEPLLQKYLPPPNGVDAYEFWGDLAGFADQIDVVAWGQPPGLAADFDERISGPGVHALDMLDDADYLTRLFTLISPHEMIEDPLFHETSGLPPVDNNIIATRVTDCDGGPTYYELDDGRTVATDEGGAMPDLDQNPAAERIEQVPMMGPAQVEVDNGPTIDELVDAYNDTRLDGPEAGNCAVRRGGVEGLLGLFALFGIMWINRRPRR
jgi:hypothetical protein